LYNLSNLKDCLTVYKLKKIIGGIKMKKENRKIIYVITNDNISPDGRILSPSSNNLFTLYKCKGFENGWGDFEIQSCEVKKINLSYSDYDKFKLKKSYYNKEIECYNKFE